MPRIVFIALLLLRLNLACDASAAPVAGGGALAVIGNPSLGGSPRTNEVVVCEALCRALQDYYPMLEMAGLAGNQWVTEYRAKVGAAPDAPAAFEIMDELVCRLNDYHTRLDWPGRPRLASPPFEVEPVLTATELPAGFGVWGQVRPPRELPDLVGVAIAVVASDPACGLRAGDEILRIDGRPVTEVLRETWRHSVGSSSGGKLRMAAARALQGARARELQLEVRRPAPGAPPEMVAIAIRRTGGGADPLISDREVAGVPVVRITEWDNRAGQRLVASFDQFLERVRASPALIIDVRDNGGGSDQLANEVVGRFIARPVISSISFHREAPTLKFERTVDWTLPRGPWRFAGRVAVLIDEGCMSACEHFVSGMIEAGALTCGTPTSGAGGWIRTVDLPGGARLRVSRTFPLHTAGVPSPQLGMAPHLWAPRRLSDLRMGRDTALQAALDWVKGATPLPPRLQPLEPLSR